MRFETGNKLAKGRKPGTKNKRTDRIKSAIERILTANIQQIKEDMAKLSPRDRVKFYVDLIGFTIAKPAPKSETIDLSKLSEAELDQIIDRMKTGQNDN